LFRSRGESSLGPGLVQDVSGLTAFAVVIAGLSDGTIGLTDVGTLAVIGGVIGEAAVRIGVAFGREFDIDGWREGMFFGGLVALLFWVFGEGGA
jgi:hypothetical protein